MCVILLLCGFSVCILVFVLIYYHCYRYIVRRPFFLFFMCSNNSVCINLAFFGGCLFCILCFAYFMLSFLFSLPSVLDVLYFVDFYVLKPLICTRYCVFCVLKPLICTRYCVCSFGLLFQLLSPLGFS